MKVLAKAGRALRARVTPGQAETQNWKRLAEAVGRVLQTT